MDKQENQKRSGEQAEGTLIKWKNGKNIKLTLYILSMTGILLLTQVLIDTVWAKSVNGEKNLVEAFREARPETMKARLTCVADYGTLYLSENDKKDLVAYLARELGTEADEIPDSTRGKSTSVLSYETESSTVKLKVELDSLEEAAEEHSRKVTQYILLDMEITNELDGVLAYQAKVNRIMKELGVEDFDTSLSLSGNFEQNLPEERKDEVVRQIFDAMDAKIVTDARNGELYSVYGYSNQIHQSITSGSKKMNLNVAMYEDETTGNTVLLVGVPVIREDY